MVALFLIMKEKSRTFIIIHREDGNFRFITVKKTMEIIKPLW